MSLADRLRRRFDAVFRGPDDLELTSGSIGAPLFFLSLPIVITNLLQVAYNIADTFWLGQYSTTALAAITFAFPMVFFLISFGMGVSVAGSVLVAQNTGADDEEQARYAASQTVTVALLLSLVLGVAGYLGVGEVLGLLGPAPEVYDGAVAYLEVISLGLFAMFGFLVFISLMRGAGDTVTPMLVMFGTVVLNIVIDPVFIFGVGPIPEMGVQGAAVATVISRTAALAVGLWLMFAGTRGIEIAAADMVPDPAYVKKLVRIGVPASVESTGASISVNVMLAIVGTFSTPVVAAFGVGIRVFSLIFMPAIALDRGVETMTGQNIGADRPDRAARANDFAAKASFVILAALGVVIYVAAPTVIGLFTDNPTVIGRGAEFLRWVAPTFGFIGILHAYVGGFRGAGRTLSAAAIMIFMLAVVRVPFAWLASRPVTAPWLPDALAPLLAFSLGPRGVWLGFAVSHVVAAAVAFAWFRQGTWRDADVTGEPGAVAADD